MLRAAACAALPEVTAAMRCRQWRLERRGGLALTTRNPCSDRSHCQLRCATRLAGEQPWGAPGRSRSKDRRGGSQRRPLTLFRPPLPVPPLSVRASRRFRSSALSAPAFGPVLCFRRASCAESCKKSAETGGARRKRPKAAPEPLSPAASASRHMGSGLAGCLAMPQGRRWPELGAKRNVVAMCVAG